MNNTENSEIEEVQEDLFDQNIIVVDAGQEPMRIDKFLLNRLERVSRSKIQEAIGLGYILVNDDQVKSNYKVRPLDSIKVSLPRDPRVAQTVEGEDIPLEIVYEDATLLVLNKPTGMVVHPGIGNYHGTLVNALVYYLKNNQLPVLSTNPATRPGLVHRLDKDTSGLMVIAKTDYAMNHLAKQFFNRTIKRSYTALVWSGFDETEGTVEGNIGRHPTDRMQMYVFTDGSAGKHAVTHYKVIEDYYYVSMVECQLETGRTHQIRVHMSYIGHPVFGDTRYGGNTIRKGTIHNKYKQFVFNCFKICPRQALHAKSLGFVHPETKESMFFESELPDDMSKLVEKWKKYYTTKSG